MAGRFIIDKCETCGERDRLQVQSSIRRELVCGFCFEGRTEYMVTDREELAVWSLIQRRQQKKG